MGIFDIVKTYRDNAVVQVKEYLTPLEKEFRKRNTVNAVKLLMERTEGRFTEEELRQIMDLVYIPFEERDNETLVGFFPEFAELSAGDRDVAIVNYCKKNVAYDLAMCESLSVYYETETASDAINAIKLKPNDIVYTNIDANAEEEYAARGQKLAEIIAHFEGNAEDIKDFIKSNFNRTTFKALVFTVNTEKTIASVENILSQFSNYRVGSLVTLLQSIDRYSGGMTYPQMVAEIEQYLLPYNESKNNFKLVTTVYSCASYSEAEDAIFS
ncbi:MAG: hypothetical protein EKK63_12725 [Acinetobacter sp.]|uniref:hypothetical protein n=1 Tax=Acinetobacter sp. TaxID=472 RepID=UPI000FBF3A5E|nr:hypothetical protein [Acinetobacter sp.]RUP38238.1 MAG: hypothetical protein EKK63_12725 [Acinetobacter sp.]